jgi:hypothetical protein
VANLPSSLAILTNRAHEVRNLYVVDTSFFFQRGFEPRLTVAAEALPGGRHVSQAHFAA